MDAQGTTRNIKEAMFIRANDSFLNRNLGKYKLPHVWDQILQNTPALQLKYTTLLLPSPSPFQLDSNHLTANYSGGHNYLLGKYSMGGTTLHPIFFLYTSLHTPYTQVHPYSLVSLVPSLVSTQYLFIYLV